jgi:hypothetical protein
VYLNHCPKEILEMGKNQLVKKKYNHWRGDTLELTFQQD